MVIDNISTISGLNHSYIPESKLQKRQRNLSRIQSGHYSMEQTCGLSRLTEYQP
jgi:chemotaxis receptor (MCP) glutamine deamidase CheD